MPGMSIPKNIVVSPVILSNSEYPDTFRVVAERVGDAAANSLLWHLPAFQIRHIPIKPSRLLQKKIIKEQYDGYNTATLAVRFGIPYHKIKEIFESDINIDFNLLDNIYMACVAEKCGMPVATKLLESFPGCAIHIPRSGKSKMTRKLIESEFTGDNQVILASKYNLSIAYIYRLLKGVSKSNQIRFEQFDLFEC